MTLKFDLSTLPSLLRHRIQMGDGRVTHSMTWSGGAAFIVRTSSHKGRTDATTTQNEFYFGLDQREVSIEVRCDGHDLGSESGLRQSTLLIPSGTSVSLQVNSHRSSEMLAVTMSDASLAAILESKTPQDLRFEPSLSFADETDWLIARLVYEACRTRTFRMTQFAEAAVTILGISLMRHREPSSTPGSSAGSQLSFAVLRQTCDFMEARLEVGVGLAEVAAIANLAPSRFASNFKRSTGLTPHAWLRQRRIARAKQLLRDPMASISVVSISVGYSSQSAFGVAFRRETGLAPSEWRKGLLG